jgi:hypothetical protein
MPRLIDMCELQLISYNLFVTVRYRHLAPCNRKRIAARSRSWYLSPARSSRAKPMARCQAQCSVALNGEIGVSPTLPRAAARPLGSRFGSPTAGREQAFARCLIGREELHSRSPCQRYWPIISGRSRCPARPPGRLRITGPDKPGPSGERPGLARGRSGAESGDAGTRHGGADDEEHRALRAGSEREGNHGGGALAGGKTFSPMASARWQAAGGKNATLVITRKTWAVALRRRITSRVGSA